MKVALGGRAGGGWWGRRARWQEKEGMAGCKEWLGGRRVVGSRSEEWGQLAIRSGGKG